MSQLTHLNASGEAHMVDVSAKAETIREARAEAYVTMNPATLTMIVDGSHHKGMCSPLHVLRVFKRQKHLAAYPIMPPIVVNQS